MDKSRFRVSPGNSHQNRPKPDRLFYEAKIEMWFLLGESHLTKVDREHFEKIDEHDLTKSLVRSLGFTFNTCGNDLNDKRW